jgi:hypothetical protein
MGGASCCLLEEPGSLAVGREGKRGVQLTRCCPLVAVVAPAALDAVTLQVTLCRFTALPTVSLGVVARVSTPLTAHA